MKMHFWRRLLFFGDALLVIASAYLGLALRFGFAFEHFVERPGILAPFQAFTGATIICLTLTSLTLYIFELNESKFILGFTGQAVRLLVAVATTTILNCFVYYWIPHYRMYRGAMMTHVALLAVGLICWRWIANRVLYKRMPQTLVVIIGAGHSGEMIASALSQHPETLYRPVGFFAPAGDFPKAHSLPLVGDLAALRAMIAEKHIDAFVIADAQDISDEAIRQLMAWKLQGYEILDSIELYKNITGKVPVLFVDDRWFLFGPSLLADRQRLGRSLLRAFDLFCGIIGLILTLPLSLPAALAVKLTSKGPVLFRQERLGRNEKPYNIYKLRTMIDNAESTTGAVWATAHDPRVTKIGRFLRRTRIDELPQFLNVIKGDMSMIGPRPERAPFVEQLKQKIPYYALRFTSKPGLTGWAQVNYRYGSTEEDAIEKLQYELYYLQERSIVLDLVIILKTIQTVLFKAGS